MKTQKFLIRMNGRVNDSTAPLVEIDIPTECPDCHSALNIFHNNAYGCDGFSGLINQCCSDRFVSYAKIWSTRIQTPTYPDGVVCTKCRSRNFYGEPNRPDGSYVCYECK